MNIRSIKKTVFQPDLFYVITAGNAAFRLNFPISGFHLRFQ